MIKQVICVRTDLGMNRGKIAAQVAHASMLFILDVIYTNDKPIWKFVETEWLFGETNIDGWNYGPITKIVLELPSLSALDVIHEAALSAGLTSKVVIDKKLNTPTCCAIGPDVSESIDAITGHLPLLRDPDVWKLPQLVRDFIKMLNRVDISNGRIYSPLFISSASPELKVESEKCLQQMIDLVGRITPIDYHAESE